MKITLAWYRLGAKEQFEPRRTWCLMYFHLGAPLLLVPFEISPFQTKLKDAFHRLAYCHNNL